MGLGVEWHMVFIGGGCIGLIIVGRRFFKLVGC